MRSFFKLPGTALLAAAALFAVVATPSAANALTFRAEAVPAAAQSGPESVQSVAINWWDARQARHDVVSALRDDCRTTGSRRNRLQCYREAHRSLRDMQRDAHEAYRDCRGDGGNRRDCRQGRPGERRLGSDHRRRHGSRRWWRSHGRSAPVSNGQGTPVPDGRLRAAVFFYASAGRAGHPAPTLAAQGRTDGHRRAHGSFRQHLTLFPVRTNLP